MTAAIDDDFVDVPRVAAIHGVCAMSSCVLSSGDESWSSDNEYVTPPLSLPHIIWNARLHAPSGISDPLPMLIDTSATTVLICDDFVTQLKLRRRPLHAPFRYKAAFGSDICSSSECVKLRVFNSDLSWSSISVLAVVVPDLCSPVVLGLPFYKRNKLFVDPEFSTIIEKVTGRNIMLPLPLPVKPHDSRTARERRQDERAVQLDRDELAQENIILEDMHFQTTRMDVIRELRLKFGEAAGQRAPPKLVSNLSSEQIVAAIQERVDKLAMLDVLAKENAEMCLRFEDCFPADIPHLDELPTHVYHRFHLIDPNMVIARRQYECPKKYREAWRVLLEQHLAAGRLRPSSSPYASPAFLIPKTDQILSDCGKGKFFAKIDMTNSFFQTRVHPDDVPLTAVTTPFGLYEWTVMPQGCRNAPATHQRRMFSAFRQHIGSICHVYLDDIVIWSQTLEEHRRNVETILQCLRENKLYCSPKKTDLFCTALHFLGHYISAKGIEADRKKVEKILDWPIPRSVSDVRAFLGSVRYISNFLPALARHTAILNSLTTKEAEKDFAWTNTHFVAFKAVKELVTSRECLTVIDHNNLGNNRIFVSCDASDFCSGAVLTYGESPESARPVAFESQQFSGAELNYPVHEKVLLGH
ncbi:hypothetical protein PHLCEN_2v3942, partial [Hermanssonia centrifuga]